MATIDFPTTSRTVRHIGIMMGAFTTLALGLALHASNPAAADDAYPSNGTHVVATVGLPAAVAFDSEAMENGDYEVARDLITGNRLFLQIRDGRADQAYIVSQILGRFDLKDKDDLGGCSTIHCANTQIPNCYALPEGGCTCSCNGGFQLQPN